MGKPVLEYEWIYVALGVSLAHYVPVFGTVVAYFVAIVALFVIFVHWLFGNG